MRGSGQGSIKELTCSLNLSRDAYYKRFKRASCKGARESDALHFVSQVRSEQPRIGTRKLHEEFKEQGKMLFGRDRLFELLRRKNLLVYPKRRFSRTTYSRHTYAIAKNRLKETTVTRPRQVVVADCTYIALRKGFAYLFLVSDIFSRKILGYHLSKDLSHYSALLALDNATSQMRSSFAVIHHSDRGCQYCCHSYLEYLADKGMMPSMTDENHCYQNAIAERINGILKDEFNLDSCFQDFAHAKGAVDHAVSIYNNKRRHFSLKLKTPAQIYALAA